jgi:ribosome-binding factor A
MALDKRAREQMLAHSAEVQPDDGLDPRDFFDRRQPKRKDNRKAKQLCRQAAETLDLVLSGEMHDPVLAGLHVVSVVPAPDSSRLLVTLHADVPVHQFDRKQIEERLEQSKGRLRSAVAAAITRRKAPVLMFNVIGPIAAGKDMQ